MGGKGSHVHCYKAYFPSNAFMFLFESGCVFSFVETRCLYDFRLMILLSLLLKWPGLQVCTSLCLALYSFHMNIHHLKTLTLKIC